MKIRKVTLYPNDLGALLAPGEPTYEEVGSNAIAATDSFGRTLARTDQVTDISNGNPRSAITIATNANSLQPYLAMALNRRVKANFALLLGLNSRDTYPGDVRNNITLKHHTSDVYGSATAVVPNSVYARIIGEAAAFQRYNGLDSETIIENDPVGGYPFTLTGFFRTDNVSGRIIALVDKSAENVYYDMSINSSGNARIQARNGGAENFGVSSDTFNDGEKHSFAAIFASATDRELYVDGISVATDTTSVAFNPAVDRISIGYLGRNTPASYYEDDIFDLIIYNRVLAPKEIAQMALGVPVPKPLITGDNSSINSIGDWAATRATIAVDTGTGNPASSMKVTATSAYGYGSLSLTSIVGHNMRLTFDYKNTVGDVAQYQVYDGTADIIARTDLADTQSFIDPGNIDFVATTTEARIILIAKNNTDIVWFDNVYLTDLDTLVTFPLVIDQWGGGTLNVSTVVNGAGANAMTTFSGASSTAATIGSTGVGGVKHWMGTVDEIAVVSGEKIFVEITMGGIGGTAPKIDLFDSLTGSSISIEGLQQLINATSHYFVFTPTSTTTGVIRIESAIGESFSGSFTGLRVGYIGAVAAWQPEGISDKWYDRSSNNLDGTNTAVEQLNAATGAIKDLYISKFDEINSANIYVDINTDDLTATDDQEITGFIMGDSFRLDQILKGSFKSPDSFPGISNSDTQGGNSLSNERYGRRNPFEWTYGAVLDSIRDQIQEIYRTHKTSRLFVLGIQEDDNDEIFYPVKFAGPLNIVRTAGKSSIGIKLLEQATT